MGISVFLALRRPGCITVRRLHTCTLDWSKAFAATDSGGWKIHFLADWFEAVLCKAALKLLRQGLAAIDSGGCKIYFSPLGSRQSYVRQLSEPLRPGLAGRRWPCSVLIVFAIYVGTRSPSVEHMLCEAQLIAEHWGASVATSKK